MKKIITKVTAVMLAMIMMGVQLNTQAVSAAKVKTAKVGRGMYTITSEKKKTARFDRVSKKYVTTLSIPATVKIGKKTYKVTAIKANALKNNKKIRKLTIGGNVKTIGKNAFYGCKNLKKITIKTTKLTMKSVGKNAFKGLNGKAGITVPDSRLAAYQKLLKARGVTGKNQIIKSGKPATETPSKKPTVIPDPKVEFRTGRFHESNPLLRDYWTDTTTETDCMVGKRREFAIRVDVPTEMYGYWTIEKVKSDFKITCHCGHISGTDKDDAEHSNQTGHYGYTILKKKDNVFDASVWHPDNTPCSIVYHATLPEGMEFVKDSTSIAQLSQMDTLLDAVGTSNYTVSIDGRNMTISINNIKTGGFCYFTGNICYLPIVASFSAKVTDSAAAVNQVTASVSYSQGKNSKTIPTNTVTINKK